MKYTQEQLEAMSEYELSCAVLILKNDVDIMTRTMQLPPSTCLGRDENNMVLMFDINNPNDMMPLAFDCKITLSPIQPTLPEHDKDLWVATCNCVEAWHKNPLRALAIAWILVKQAA